MLRLQHSDPDGLQARDIRLLIADGRERFGAELG
jgi:hypothetical protein